MSLFGSSGIRGVVGGAMTPELALAIGAAVGSMCHGVVMAKDTRTSGDMVMAALAAGVMSTGSCVSIAGMVPTPTLARAAESYDAGLMVTASHNPPEYNGVKMWNPDGSAFGAEQMCNVEGLIEAKGQRLVGWESVGTSRAHSGAIDEHMEAVLESVGVSSASVVLDCGCGATCAISPVLLRRLGCSVVALNCQPDGFFPGRPSEPSEENLNDLREVILRKGADVGIAHDGDGDRMVAFDEKGRYIDGDRLLALFTVLTGAKEVVAPVDASMVLDDLVKGKVIRTRVGDVYVSEALKASGGGFGGEPSGTFIFPEETYCPDGVFAGAYLLSMLEGRRLSELVDSIPRYPVQRRSFPFAAEARSSVEEKLGEAMASLRCLELITVDGYRAQFEEGWILVRLSGTEPKVRITVEAREQSDLKALVAKADDAVRRCLE
ncbi:MAG: phosphoglucosamine mutase [Methanomassiliicoccales archaeon]|nr:phosphoglucosamine mutase [Methanomassiliicoccales archaeon]